MLKEGGRDIAQHATAAARRQAPRSVARATPTSDLLSWGPSKAIKATRNRQLTAVAETMAAAAPSSSSSSSARARALPRPLHPLARGGPEREEMEAVAATHPGAPPMRRKGRKQKQVRTGLDWTHRCLPPIRVLLLRCRFCLFRPSWCWCLTRAVLTRAVRTYYAAAVAQDRAAEVAQHKIAGVRLQRRRGRHHRRRHRQRGRL